MWQKDRTDAGGRKPEGRRGEQGGGGFRRAPLSRLMRFRSPGISCAGSVLSASPPEGTHVGLDGEAGHTEGEAGVPTALLTSGEAGAGAGLTETPGGSPGSFPATQGREGPLGTGQKA